MIKDSKIHYITFFMSRIMFQLDKILDEIILVPDNLRKTSPLPSSSSFLVGPHPSAADCVKARAPAPGTQCNVIDGVTQIKKKTPFLSVWMQLSYLAFQGAVTFVNHRGGKKRSQLI